MSLFQKSVEKKYLSELDSALIEKKFKQFKDYFGNPQIQENIRNSKEEQFQEGFLRELFVTILGYTLNPQPNFNLTTELKNTANSKKADGAILKGEDAIAVIELKGTDTTDLDKIETQAFGYKNHNPKCVYVITSNFEKLRFYIQNAVDHIDFDLFNLSKEQFSLLWLCLSKDNLLNGLPLKIKESSVLQEENITKKLYTDYTKFREAIYTSLVKNNPDTDKLLLFKKTQKLLDRFLFIFFAEDRLLLPPNSISEIVKQWATLKEDLDEYVPLYDRFKKYFGYMNTGYSGKKYEIFAYNGGLFAPDEVLDNIAIDDNILYEHTMKLSQYDYETDVDVNILGHIFENSLGEIETVQAEIKGEQIDTQKTKRKKDGIFYTPKYITKYIVENTVGKLCEEKRNELGIIDEEFAKGRKNRKKEIVIELDKKLTDYRNWLLTLTILDPACGSGAFLNQALDFLITEHRKIDELRAQLLGGGIVFSDITTDILEKNIYGVDLNEESVEIAKLSLWLRTAQKGRKLNKLNNNIKCGNSLIDDPDVAGDKAFNWEKEFSEIFVNGGFDVVIGNPPYVSRNMSDELKANLKSNYKTSQYQFELYIAFIEKGSKLIKDNSYFSLIVPNSWLKNMMMSECRKYILDNLNIIELIPSIEKAFSDASVDTMIFLFSKQKGNDLINIKRNKQQDFLHKHFASKSRFYLNDGYIFDVEVSQAIQPILLKLKLNSITVGEIFDVTRGINPYDKYTGQNEEVINTRAYHADYKKDSTFVPELKGMHLSRYSYNWDQKHYISYGDWLAAPRQEKYFTGERIIFREILGKTLISALISEDFKIDRSLYIAKYDKDLNDNFDIYYILGILNSKLLAFYFRYSNNEFDNLFPKIRVAEFKKLPIKNFDKSKQTQLSKKVELIIDSIKIQNTLNHSLLKLLQSKYETNTLTKNIQNWADLDFKQFLKELSKSKIFLKLNEEAEWLEYFNSQKIKALDLNTEIEKTDKEIDQMVYELYGLTEEEIKIVEESI